MLRTIREAYPHRAVVARLTKEHPRDLGLKDWSLTFRTEPWVEEGIASGDRRKAS